MLLLERAVGISHTGRPSPSDLEDKFNGYVEGKLLIIVEEMRTPEGTSVFEKLF